eukprot:1671830-Pleurochrysis_carterae.AAC.1
MNYRLELNRKVAKLSIQQGPSACASSQSGGKPNLLNYIAGEWQKLTPLCDIQLYLYRNSA